MSVLTRRDPLGQTNDQMVAFFAAPVPGPSKSPVLKVNPDRGHESGGAKRARGVGLTKLEAEDLLDWLEVNGRSGKLTLVAGCSSTRNTHDRRGIQDEEDNLIEEARDRKNRFWD